MHKDHLNQEPQGLKSTQSQPTTNTNIDRFPPEITTKSHFVYASCFQATGKFYGDPTGRFVAPSISGNEYILVVFDYDTNTIHTQDFLLDLLYTPSKYTRRLYIFSL